MAAADGVARRRRARRHHRLRATDAPKASTSSRRASRRLAYWLSQASIAIDPIIYDQLSRFGLRQKRLLETIVAHPQGVKPDVMQKIVDFTKLFWANKGNHNELTVAEIPAGVHLRGVQEPLPDRSWPPRWTR